MLSAQNLKISIVILFHLIGLGLLFTNHLSAYQPLLTPFHLLLMTYLILSESKWNWTIVIGIYAFSFGIELIGVKTGLLFGDYTYLSNLGIKLYGTPLIIGVNWVLIAFITRGATQLLVENKWLRIGLSVVCMLLLDILIEPIAHRLGFWSWKGNTIPVQNFVMWGVLSFCIQGVLEWQKVKVDAVLSNTVLLAQYFFFGVLYLFL